MIGSAGFCDTKYQIGVIQASLSSGITPTTGKFVHPFVLRENSFYGDDLFSRTKNSVIDSYPSTFVTLAQKIVD